MDIFARFRTISEEDKTQAIRQLIEDASPDFDYFLLIGLSVVMATLGLLAGSETIVIGAMLLAPLLAPILALALGISMPNHKLIYRSFTTLLWSVFYAVAASVFATFLFAFGDAAQVMNPIIAARIEPSLLYFLVAVVSGFAVSYATVKPDLSATLPGIAIAVALVPPIAVVGIGVAWADSAIIAGSLVMFLINVFGIVFAAMATFSLLDVHHKRFLADKTIKKETERIEEEKQEMQEVVKKHIA